jgi:hypothetical protein
MGAKTKDHVKHSLDIDRDRRLSAKLNTSTTISTDVLVAGRRRRFEKRDRTDGTSAFRGSVADTPSPVHTHGEHAP